MANNFLPFGIGGGANVLTQGAWAGLSARSSGFLSGVARSAEVNKALRQSAAISSMIGDFIANHSLQDALDDGNIAVLLARFESAIRRQDGNYIAAGGTGNALTVTLAPVPTDYAQLLGIPLRIIIAVTNTGSATLNANTLGAVTLRRQSGAECQPGDLVTGQVVEVIKTASQWRLTHPVASDYSGAQNLAVFTTSDTFICPATSVVVETIGGGGGGGGVGDASGGGIAGNAGGGGGGGGYGLKLVSGLLIGQSVAITVGGGGAGGNLASGVAGGDSSFGSFMTAGGGGGGNWGENGLTFTGTGGTVTGADVGCTGGDGGIGGPNVALGSNATQSDTQRLYNKGGIAAGGLSTMVFGGTGANGRGYGTGGGGASGVGAGAGGAGAPGIVIVRW